jgi:hypothetical protein
MKLNMLAAFVLASGILVAGCGDSKTDDATTLASPSTRADATKGAALGMEKANEHFGITLTAEPSELKVGNAKFTAKVLHHGQPTEGASVKLSLSMPSMNMGGSEVELKHTSGGVYEGEADLSMGGDWRAKVSVGQEGHSGEADYDFVVMQ